MNSVTAVRLVAALTLCMDPVSLMWGYLSVFLTSLSYPCSDPSYTALLTFCTSHTLPSLLPLALMPLTLLLLLHAPILHIPSLFLPLPLSPSLSLLLSSKMEFSSSSSATADTLDAVSLDGVSHARQKPLDLMGEMSLRFTSLYLYFLSYLHISSPSSHLFSPPQISLSSSRYCRSTTSLCR